MFGKVCLYTTVKCRSMTTKSDMEMKEMIKKFKHDRSNAKREKEKYEEYYCNGAIDVLEWILYGKEIE